MWNQLWEPVEIKGTADWHVKWWQWTTSASVTGSVTLISSHCWQETQRGDHLSSNPCTFWFSFIINSGDYLILYCCQHILNSTYYSVSVVQLMQWWPFSPTIYLSHRHGCYLSYQYSYTDNFSKESSKVQKQYYTMKWFSMLRIRTISKDKTDMYIWNILTHKQCRISLLSWLLINHIDNIVHCNCWIKYIHGYHWYLLHHIQIYFHICWCCIHGSLNN